MKILSMSIALIVLATLLLSCKKEGVNRGPGMEGVYVGKWGDVTGDPHSFYKLEFKTGGNLNRFDQSGNITATGSWNLDGIEVEATYIHTNGEKHSIAGLYTDFNGEIMGTWGYGTSKAGGGNFLLKRQ